MQVIHNEQHNTLTLLPHDVVFATYVGGSWVFLTDISIPKTIASRMYLAVLEGGLSSHDGSTLATMLTRVIGGDRLHIIKGSEILNERNVVIANAMLTIPLYWLDDINNIGVCALLSRINLPTDAMTTKYDSINSKLFVYHAGKLMCKLSVCYK